ncbi:MAG TPA: SDR family NAD(P)-dependent oxidoreductase [Acidimicrobiales bacterium]
MWNEIFAGSTVIVSGGATGIGAAAVSGFARAGANTVLADVADELGEVLVASLVDEGLHADYRHCDVSVESDVERTFAWVAERYGAIDVVFANAGIEWTKDARHTTLGEWQRVIDVNLTGMFLVGRASLRSMCENARGALIMTSSPHAVATVADTVAYAASKGGVSALVHALSLEAAPYNVRVNGVVPGTIDTPMVRRELQASSNPELQHSLLASSQPLQRVGQSEDVANLVMFLASPMAGFITGALMPVDGGLMAGLPTGSPASYQD